MGCCKMHQTFTVRDEMVCFSLNFVNKTADSIKAEISISDEKCKLHGGVIYTTSSIDHAATGTA
jgi:predicted outer membrane repeat protein